MTKLLRKKGCCEMEKSTNSIDIGGRILTDFEFNHEVYGEAFYLFNVSVDRLSGNHDVLPVTASERAINRESMTKGKPVKISGQVRSYNSYVEADKKNKLVLTVFARSVELVEELPAVVPNDVFLDGYLCKPAIYRTTPFGREITDLLLAVNRSYNKSDYIPCIVWGRNARMASKLVVGDNVHIAGRMQSRVYQKRIDENTIVDKTAYEVSVSKVWRPGEGERRPEQVLGGDKPEPEGE